MCSLIQYQTPSLRKDLLDTLHKLIPDVLPVFLIISMVMKVTEEEARAFHIKRWGGWTASYTISQQLFRIDHSQPLLSLSSMINRTGSCAYTDMGVVKARRIKGWGWTMPSIPVSLLRDIEIMNSGSGGLMSLLGIRARTHDINQMNKRMIEGTHPFPDDNYHSLYNEWAYELTNISMTLSDPFMEFWVEKDTYIRLCIGTEHRHGTFGAVWVELRIKNDIFKTHDLLNSWSYDAESHPHLLPLNIQFPPEFILNYKQKINKIAIPFLAFGTTAFNDVYGDGRAEPRTRTFNRKQNEICNDLEQSFQWWEYPEDLD